jgi:hypothetical protein
MHVCSLDMHVLDEDWACVLPWIQNAVLNHSLLYLYSC